MEKETENNENKTARQATDGEIASEFVVKPIEQIRLEIDAAKANVTQEEIDLIRNGMSQTEANGALKRIRSANNVLKSADGHTAELSTRGTNKLMSNEAADKTINNGFTREQHNAIAADIDHLFANAKKIATSPDKNNDPNIKAMHKFVAPLSGDDVAYITVKEPVGHNKKMYSVELMKIGKLDAIMNEVARSITSLGSPSVPITK